MAAPILVTLVAFVHVAAAVAWLGSGILFASSLVPALRSLSPAATGEFIAKAVPRVVRFTQATAGTTILFGLVLLYFKVDGDFSALAPTSSFGLGVSAGMLLGLIAFLVGMGVAAPTFTKASRLAASQEAQSNGPEIGRLMKRGGMASTLVVLLLLLALFFMVWAGFY